MYCKWEKSPWRLQTDVKNLLAEQNANFAVLEIAEETYSNEVYTRGSRYQVLLKTIIETTEK